MFQRCNGWLLGFNFLRKIFVEQIAVQEVFIFKPHAKNVSSCLSLDIAVKKS
jgi:hypothetical protein